MPLLGVPAYVALALVGVVAAAVAAVAGFGIGSLVTPVLAVLVGTRAAVAIVAVPHAVATGLRLWRLRASVDGRVLRTFGLTSAAGGLAGALLHGTLASPALTVALGALLIVSGVSELTGWAATLRLGPASSMLAGAVSGLFGGLVGNQGGIRSAALMRFGLPRDALVATATATGLLVDAARLPIYVLSSGDELVAAAPIVLVLTVAVVVGTLGGVRVLQGVPERRFRQLLAALLVVLGVSLIVSVAV